ncbi:uncharacterized protein LOC143521427 isoform X2 [Brachyhypopomus gauderio]|uniref:uncharacterized protein LOC143521427 isoform X2 n=1 Tax=Brachyhypopomus gauderio TaxID=698409 RepID=UPI0040429BDF
MGVTHGKKTDHSHQQLQSGCAQPLIGPDSLSDVGSVVGCDQRGVVVEEVWKLQNILDQRSRIGALRNMQETEEEEKNHRSSLEQEPQWRQQ